MMELCEMHIISVHTIILCEGFKKLVVSVLKTQLHRFESYGNSVLLTRREPGTGVT